MSPHAVLRRLTVPVKLYVRDGTELLRGLSPAARDAVRRASEAARLAGSLDTHVETALAVQAAFDGLGLSRAFTFHSLNRRAADFAAVARAVFAALGDAEPIHVGRVDGHMPPAERQAQLDAFRAATKEPFDKWADKVGAELVELFQTTIADPGATATQ